MAAIVRPRFYPVLAWVLALVVFIGFARTFYLSFLFQLPPRTLLLTLHGTAFTAWVLLFVAQTRLIAKNRIHAHRRLGVVGVALAMLVFALGVLTALASIKGTPPGGVPLNGAQFSIVPFTAIGLFGVCVAAAIAFRRRPQMHKRLMILAMISVIAPAVARILFLLSAGKLLPVVQIGVTVAILGACLVYDWTRNRIVHPVYTIGGAILVLSWPLRMWVAHTAAWENFARSLVN